MFYQALSALQLNRDEEALSLLTAYLNISDPTFTRQAQWYLALAYIKVGKPREAVGLLEQFVSSKGYKQREAVALINELGR